MKHEHRTERVVFWTFCITTFCKNHVYFTTCIEATSLCAVAMQSMLSESYTLRLLQEASDTRRRNMLSEACKRYGDHHMQVSSPSRQDHKLISVLFLSMESLDKKFEQMLALQQLDKSKAICQILQEVKLSTCSGCAGSDFLLG